MRRIVFAFLCAFCVFVANSSAQITFQKAYGDSTVNDNGQSILQTSDGGYLIGATRFTSGNQVESIFLVRTNISGDTLWTKLIREPTVNYSCSQVIQTYDGGFAITGYKGGGITFVPFLIRLDTAGNLISNRSYLWFANEHVNSIVQTPDSGFLLAGYHFNGNNLVYFIRTDSTGDTLWTKAYGETFFNANIYSLRIAKDGGFIATGSIQNTNTQDVDVFLFKTDATGNVQWAKSYGDIGYDYAQQVEVTSDSGFIIAAVTYSFGAGLADYYLIKTDSVGNQQWSKTYGGTSDDRSESVRQTEDGGYLISGESASFLFVHFDGYMVRTDSNGDTLWTKTINSLQNNEAYSMILTSDSGFAITGTYFNQFNNNDVFFLKTDANGSMGCTESSTATTVNNPPTITTNHHLNYFPSQPSVISHTLEINSGGRMETLCLPSEIKDDLDQNSILIHPNPVSETLSIEIKGESKSSIRIFNLIGAAVSLPTAYCLLPTQIDVHDLTPGIYFLQIDTEHQVYFKRFVKH